MKKGILVILAISMAAPAAHASSVCHSISSLARATMNARQAGIPMDEIYENGEDEAPEVENIRKSLIRIAYDRPRFGTERYKIEAAEDFASEVFRRCVVARGE